MPKSSNSRLKVKIWGVRGSIPVPGSATLRYGGNTSCVEVRADDEIIVLDAGSGIRGLGNSLDREFDQRPFKVTLLSTHAHWDHIQGLPFLLPAYQEKNELRLLGYKGVGGSFGAILSRQMAVPFFPVRLRDLPCDLSIEELNAMEFTVGGVRIQSKFVNHPGNCVGYRLFANGARSPSSPTTSHSSTGSFTRKQPLGLLLNKRGSSRFPNAPSWSNFFTARMCFFSTRNIRMKSTKNTSAGATARSLLRWIWPRTRKWANCCSFTTIQITTTT